MSIYKRLAESKVGQLLGFKYKQPAVEPKPEKKPIDRAAVLREITERTYAEVRSKFPGVIDFEITETHTGGKTPPKFSHNMLPYGRVRELIGGHDGIVMSPWVRNVFLRSLNSDLYLLQISSGAYDLQGNKRKDTYGRPYNLEMFMLIPKDTAERLVECIKQDGNKIIFEMYTKLFPKNAEVNIIKVARNLTVDKDGQATQF